MQLVLLDIFMSLSQNYDQPPLFPKLWLNRNVHRILLSQKTSWCKWRKPWIEDLHYNTNSCLSLLGHSVSVNFHFPHLWNGDDAVLLPQSWANDLLEETCVWKYLGNIAACKYRGHCFLEPSPVLCFSTYLLRHSWYRWSGSIMVISEI